MGCRIDSCGRGILNNEGHRRRKRKESRELHQTPKEDEQREIKKRCALEETRKKKENEQERRGNVSPVARSCAADHV